MVEYDGHVGQLLKKLDDMGIADNTIVMYSTDNGAETASWPDRGITPFHGEKGTNWEGGHRVPLMVRWPGVLKPGTKINHAIAHNDWMPTLLAAAGESDVEEKLLKGHKANGKDWEVKLDGYNFLPFFKGDEGRGPRAEYFYFGRQGDLNAVRCRDWKVHFGIFEGNLATGIRVTPNWPLTINLKADPYEFAGGDPKTAANFLAITPGWMRRHPITGRPSRGVFRRPAPDRTRHTSSSPTRPRT